MVKTMDFKELSLTQIIEWIKSGEYSREEVFDYFMDRIEKHDGKVKSFNYINKEGLNNTDGLLAWVPIWVKDIFCEKGILTTAASNMLRDFKPVYNSTVIENLLAEGMSSIGKLNMDEFAMGSSSESSAIQTTYNPWDLTRIPGGSSGGSAAAVAAWLVPAALGTDTGGSIRQPASVCWVVGFKPSYGRNSRYGIIAMASSLDTPGTFTKTVKDAGLLYDIMNGEDAKDSTILKGKDKLDDKIWDKKDLKWIKLGVIKEFMEEWMDEGVKKVVLESIGKMKELGAEIKEISLPMSKYALAAYYILMPAEVSTNLARLDGIRYGHNSEEARESLDEMYKNNRGEGFGDEAQRRILLGSYVLSAGFYDAYFKKASEIRTLVINDFKKAFEEVDAIIAPTSPSVAFKIGENTEDPLKMYMEDMYTIPASLAWLPGFSIPAGYAKPEDGEDVELPVWIQLTGSYQGEEKLFEVAHVFEQNSKVKTVVAPQFRD